MTETILVRSAVGGTDVYSAKPAPTRVPPEAVEPRRGVAEHTIGSKWRDIKETTAGSVGVIAA